MKNFQNCFHERKFKKKSNFTKVEKKSIKKFVKIKQSKNYGPYRYSFEITIVIATICILNIL